MATEQGVVIRTDSTAAWVKTVRTSACQGCIAKGSCHTMGGGNDMEVKAMNEVGAKAGDRIILGFKTTSLLKATFLLYVLPILVLITGAALGQKIAPMFDFNPSAFSAILGFSFFFAAILIVKTRANQLAKKIEYQPKIVKILK